MSFDTDQTMMSEINVTPLVDVMLVLLVVFIITAPLLAPQLIKVTLPKTVAVAFRQPGAGGASRGRRARPHRTR